jgi:protein SCO1
MIAMVAAAVAISGAGLTLHAVHQRASPSRMVDTQDGLRGRVAQPTARPDFTLLDTEGRPFDFRAETEGRLALLSFGYTHCPDVCPVHLANLAEVLRDLPYRERDRVRVVFVTVDPARDTPERIRAWLDAFDPRFAGLWGSAEEVSAILAALDLPPAAIGALAADGEYVVGHAAAVLAFGPEGPLRAFYPFGTRQIDWARDLPELLRGNGYVSGQPTEGHE